MAEPLVAFEEVALRSPGGRQILAGADWMLGRGERVRIGGRGSGATLLLRLCAGLAHPQGGSVVLGGVPHHPFRFDHPFLLRGAVGWVPQEGDLISNLTLLDNVTLQARFAGGAEPYGAERAARGLLCRLGLEEVAWARPDALSRQQRKLGALARAALAGAELWLVDRLLDGLDEEARSLALDLLGERLEPLSVTMLIAGDGPEIERLAPRTLRLEEGRLSTLEER
jgi:ABC-type lipoprotein export system ATPase subunit